MYRLLCLILPFSIALPTLASEPPAVVLSAGHQKTCKVKIGDKFPAIDPTAPDGKPHPLTEFYGKQATVVAVVGELHWASKQLLADLPRDVTATYGKRGVNVLVIATGGKANLPPDAEGYTLLKDADGSRFAKLGSGRLPRVYVLDSQEKLAWFDIEYSQSTRRELKQALEALVDSQ